jgi:CheY-like chemotaxis protein
VHDRWSAPPDPRGSGKRPDPRSQPPKTDDAADNPILVVMTAADNAKRWADEVGADGYVVKPFEFLDLLASVEKHRRLPPRH